MRKLIIQSLLIVLFSSAANAVVETYDFDNEVLQKRYANFIDELRCPKCQNQNLSGSNSPIAADLRRELHRLLHDGKSDTEIVHFMVNRYGEFVLYRPPFNPETALLWFAPVIFLVLGGIIVFLFVKRQKAPAQEQFDKALDDNEQQQLDQLLANADEISEKKKGDVDV